MASKPIYRLGKEWRDPQLWVRGQKTKVGASSKKLIHMAVGHAHSNWESVEGAAASLFGQLVDSTSVAATRAYGTIIGALRPPLLRDGGQAVVDAWEAGTETGAQFP
jgi:hypothetical protein